jgi:hypothetical protein
MIKRIQALGGIVLTALMLSACNSPSEEEKTAAVEVPEGWVLHEADGPYALASPPEWEMDYSGRMNTQFILFSPQDSINDFFRENINLIIEDVSSQSITIDDYLEQSKKILFEYITDLKNLKIQKEQDFFWLSYEGRQGTMNLSYFQRMSMKRDTVYVLTYTSIADRPTERDEEVEDIMRTFTVD